MKDILYIGPYREFSDTGIISRKYIQSLSLTKNNIAVKPFYNLLKSYPQTNINSSVLELEDNKKDEYDIVIQHAFPHQLCYDSKFEKNIAIVNPECLNYGLDYFNYINQMDIIIVPSEFSKRSLIGCGVDQNKIYTVPVPIDLVEIDSFKNALPEKSNNKYSFYIIDDFISKSNIETILLAFLVISSKYQNIELIIKIEQSTNFSENTFKEIINNIYSLFPADHSRTLPTIINGETDYSKVLAMHNNCDCLIDISSGKSFSCSILEAMVFNNNIIALNDTAQSEIIEDNCGLIVDSEYTNCLDNNKIFFMYNTIRQIWSKPILNDLINTMEKALLESDIQKRDRIKAQDKKIQYFSMKAISELLENIL
jgi:hypothetical protein